MFLNAKGEMFDDLPEKFSDSIYYTQRGDADFPYMVCTDGVTFYPSNSAGNLRISVSKKSKNSKLYSVECDFYPEDYKIHIKYRIIRLMAFNQQLITHIFHGLIVINVRTGYSYSLGLKTGKGRLVNGETPVKNCSYSCHEMPFFNKFNHFGIIPVIKEWKKQLYPDLTLREFDITNYTLFDIMMYNRFPMHLFTDIPYILNCGLQRKIRHNANDSLLSVIDSYGLPNVASVRRLIVKYPMSVNMLYKFLKFTKNLDYSVNLTYIYCRFYDAPEIWLLFKCMLRELGVSVTCRKLLRCKSSDFIDAARIFQDIRRAKLKVNFRQSIAELHDNFMQISYKLKYPLIEFDTYPELETDLIVSAKDSDELYEVGESLDICVFSYRNLVKSKKCSIFLLKKDGIHADVCIELSGDQTRIVQAKSRYNEPPTEEDREIIFKWASKNNLCLDTSDLFFDIVDDSDGLMRIWPGA